MNKLNFILIFFVFVFLSNTCQKQPEEEQRVVTISVDAEETNIIPSVDEQSSYTEYGPGQVNPNTQALQTSEKINTVGIIIGASSDFDTDVMDYVSCLLKNDVKINFVAGIGSSSAIAAMLAQTKKPELVKWKFFRLKERTNAQEIVENLELDARTIKKSSIAYYLTTVGVNGNITFMTKGNIVEGLKNNIENNKKILAAQIEITNEDIARLIAQRVFVFSYEKNLSVSKNQINGKMIQINMPKQNFSLMKKCEIIKENL
ncbi:MULTISPECIES: hypothetical protein [Pseudomonadati]|uniref:hypothetical protein n=1 Tax=unclassified Halobacteriovorax TaxID=2639665 RepID=UPI000CD1D16B|nr:hypothetical protein [Halobacteriovorax sp. DA5]POB13312.1 hypothetical protein C0Z22_12440 [Halobacteriovorax sp. DA5]